MPGTSIYNVRDFGAQGNGSTDDSGAIQVAINLAGSATLGGGIVYFPAGDYAISNTLTVTENYIQIVGAGNGATRITANHAGMCAISVSGTVGAGMLTPTQAVTIEMLDVIQPSPGTNTAATNIGVSFLYTGICQLRDVNIEGFFVGVKLFHATQTNVQRVQSLYGGTAVSPTGFSLDGGHLPGTNPKNALGNNSSYFRDCGVGFNPSATSNGGVGYYIFSSTANGNCSDLTFDNCGCEYGSYGWIFNFSSVKSNAEADSDIELFNPIATEYLNAGILIQYSPDYETGLLVCGGFLSPASAPVGIVYGIQILNSFRGASIIGTQFFPVNTSPATYAAYGIYCGATVADIVVSGCQFNGQTYGVYCDSTSSNVSITGNRFYSTPAGTIGRALNPAIACVGASNISVTGNTFSATSAGGIVTGIYFDSNTTKSVAIGNVIGSNVTNPIVNSGTNNNTQNNPGYNPAALSAPAVPASTVAITNTTGVDALVGISTNATTTVSQVVIAGLITGGTMAISSHLMVALPANQTISLTYAGGTPTWTWVGN